MPRLGAEKKVACCASLDNALTCTANSRRRLFTDAQGNPDPRAARESIKTKKTPLAMRWAAGYARAIWNTAATWAFSHTAVDLLEPRRHPDVPDEGCPGQSIDVSKYPARHSDIVATVVHGPSDAHANLLTRVSYDTNIKRRPGLPKKKLLRYRFRRRSPARSRSFGTRHTSVVRESRVRTNKAGAVTAGSSILESRLFKHRCSYVIYSAAFEPNFRPVKERLCTRPFVGWLSGPISPKRRSISFRGRNGQRLLELRDYRIRSSGFMELAILADDRGRV